MKLIDFGLSDFIKPGEHFLIIQTQWFFAVILHFSNLESDNTYIWTKGFGYNNLYETSVVNIIAFAT